MRRSTGRGAEMWTEVHDAANDELVGDDTPVSGVRPAPVRTPEQRRRFARQIDSLRPRGPQRSSSPIPPPLPMRGAPKGVSLRKEPTGKHRVPFRSTALGTAVFIAEVHKRIPVRTQLAVLALAATAGLLATWAYHHYGAREAARAELDRALALPAPESAAAVRRAVRAGLDGNSHARALAHLGQVGDESSLPLLIEGLSGPSEVRRAAATSIARLGTGAAKWAEHALVVALQDANAVERAPVAWVLASTGNELGLRHALDALAEGSLQALEAYRPEDLAQWMGPERLVSALHHEANPVRQLAARELHRFCGPAVNRALERAARRGASLEGDAGVAVKAAVSLAQCNADRAAPVIARTAQAEAAYGELMPALARELGAPGLAMLWPAAVERRRQAALVAQIAALGDPRAGSALEPGVHAVPESDSALRLALGKALAEASAPAAVDVLAPLARSGGESLAREAVTALARSELGQHLEAPLLEIAAERPALRNHVFEAFGRAGACSADAVAVMTDALRSPDAPSALRGLAGCGEEKAASVALDQVRRTSTGRATDSSDRDQERHMRAAAYDAIARLDVREAAPALLTIILDGSQGLADRTAAGDTFGQVGGDEDLVQAAELSVDPATRPSARQALMRALRHRLPARAADILFEVIDGSAGAERAVAAAVPLGESDDPGVRDALRRALGNPRAEPFAALALSLGPAGGAPEALPARLRADTDLERFVRRHLRELPIPWTRADFDRGRVSQRLRALAQLRDAGFDAPWHLHVEALDRGGNHPGNLSRVEWRRLLARILRSPRESRVVQDAARDALRAVGARGMVMATES